MPVIQTSVPVYSYSSSEKALFYEEINKLLKIGAISKCQPCKNQYLSGIFLRPKPNGKKRLILNLKKLNKFIRTSHFKLEDMRTALKLVTHQCNMATMDLKDAYFLIKMHPDSRKFLRFSFDNQLYEFNVLPFGLNTAPYVFTKIMKPVSKFLRSAGLLSTVYLDDWLLFGQNREQCLTNITITKDLLTSLGFIINEEKSVLVPSDSCKFLGMIIDSNNFQISLPADKRSRIKKELEDLSSLNRCKIRKFAQVVGLLVSACPAVEYGWLYTKEMERCKYLNLKNNDGNYDSFMSIPESLLPDIRWWLNSIGHATHRIRHDEYRTEIYSDASTTGWGAACGEETASGQWSNNERQYHINYLELLAAFIALKIFAKNLHNCQILLRLDNATAISYVNRMGGIQFPHLTNISKQIWQWCESQGLFVLASYIKSKDNSVADAESRRNHPDIEWEIANHAFELLTNNFGKPDIDLFASRINKKCEKYMSWHRDPDAQAIDSFTVPWSKYFFYAFPPFSIILKTLRKIIADKARGIVIVPMWPTQPWFPLFTALLTSEMITFPPQHNVLISHSSSSDHRRLDTSLTLVAGVLCGRRYPDGAYHHRPWTSC